MSWCAARSALSRRCHCTHRLRYQAGQQSGGARLPQYGSAMGGTEMSDTVGRDGPSGAGDDGPVVITVNGRRMWFADNVTVALLLESLGYPARGVAVALNRAVLPRAGHEGENNNGAQCHGSEVQSRSERLSVRSQIIPFATRSRPTVGLPTAWRVLIPPCDVVAPGVVASMPSFRSRLPTCRRNARESACQAVHARRGSSRQPEPRRHRTRCHRVPGGLHRQDRTWDSR